MVYLVEDHQWPQDYEIDEDRVFLAGFSAGAMISLHVAYSSDDELSELVGNIHHYELGGKSALAGGREVPIAGVIAMGGGMFLPSDIDSRDLNNTPLLLMHGELDEVVPYNSGKPFSFLEKDVPISLGGFAVEIGVEAEDLGNSINESFEWLQLEWRRIEVSAEVIIPKQWITTIKNLITREIYGSYSLYQNASNNCWLVTYPGEGHAFMKSEGALNNNYYDSLDKILQFPKKHEK